MDIISAIDGRVPSPTEIEKFYAIAEMKMKTGKFPLHYSVKEAVELCKFQSNQFVWFMDTPNDLVFEKFYYMNK